MVQPLRTSCVQSSSWGRAAHIRLTAETLLHYNTHTDCYTTNRLRERDRQGKMEREREGEREGQREKERDRQGKMERERE